MKAATGLLSLRAGLETVISVEGGCVFSKGGVLGGALGALRALAVWGF